MIQGFTETNFTAYISTEDNRIDKTAPLDKIRFLVKLINDMNGDVEYVYPALPSSINPRYTEMVFGYDSQPIMYAGTVNLLPAGHWKYEVYEVVWLKLAQLDFEHAPATELDVLPVNELNGVVQGLVTKGILNLTEKVGTEQVQYTEHESGEGENYVWYGEDIDVWNPDTEPSMVAFYKNKEGITLDVNGNVSEWLDSSVNTYDISQDTANIRPSYTPSTGGVIFGSSDYLSALLSYDLTADFTIAFKIKASSFIGTILDDRTKPSAQLGLGDLDTITLINTLAFGILLHSTTGNWSDAYVVITRDSLNDVTLHVNGVQQSPQNTSADDFKFSMIGTDNPIFNSLDGSLFELQVYSSTSPQLTIQINNRLSNL